MESKSPHQLSAAQNGYRQTNVGVIPSDWNASPLGHHAVFRTGPFGSLLHRSDYVDGGTPVINPMQIVDGKLVATPSMAVAAPAARRLSAFSLSPGEVIIGRRGEMGRCALVGAEHEGWICGTGSMIIRTRSGLRGEFLQRLLSSQPIIAAIESACVGTTMINLNNATLNKLLIPLPPTRAEQEAIAGALADADALIDSLRQLIAKKRDLKQAAMQELLTGKTRLPGFGRRAGTIDTDHGVIPEDWTTVSAFDACLKIQDGTHFSPRTGGNDHFYITSKNIRFGVLDITTAAKIDAAQHQTIYRRCDVKKGDLLLTKDGAKTGNAALNTLDEEFSLLSSVAFLRFQPDAHCAAFFLQQVLSRRGQRQIQDAMAGNAITRLTLEKIRKLRFPIPPTHEEQAAIAAVLSDMDAEIDALKAKLAKVRQIKLGMMQQLLTGRVRLV